MGPGPAALAVERVRIDRILDETPGGLERGLAMVCEIGGRKYYVKANRNPAVRRKKRWGNFEAEILAHELFEMVGIRSPRARVVRVSPGTHAFEALGEFLLAIEWVDAGFASALKLDEHPVVDLSRSRLDQFICLALMDVLTGNVDRSAANVNWFQATEWGGKLYPIPTIAHLRDGRRAPSLHGQVLDSPELRPAVLARARRLVARLDDREIDRMLSLIPREVLPPDARADLDPPWRSELSPDSARRLVGGHHGVLQGDALFRFRIAELRRTLIWRRDHLLDALRAYQLPQR